MLTVSSADLSNRHFKQVYKGFLICLNLLERNILDYRQFWSVDCGVSAAFSTGFSLICILNKFLEGSITLGGTFFLSVL